MAKAASKKSAPARTLEQTLCDSVQVPRRLFVFDLSGRVSLRSSSVVFLDLARRPIVQLAV